MNCTRCMQLNLCASSKNVALITVYVGTSELWDNLYSILLVVCEYGALRLVNGTTNLEGRVEICINETWGTVCDGLWSTFDATVACRQLGYSPIGALPLYNAAFGAGTGTIWIDDLLCNNRESRLIDCPNGGIGMIDFCNGHNDDASLRCLEGKAHSSEN